MCIWYANVILTNRRTTMNDDRCRVSEEEVKYDGGGIHDTDYHDKTMEFIVDIDMFSEVYPNLNQDTLIAMFEFINDFDCYRDDLFI